MNVCSFMQITIDTFCLAEPEGTCIVTENKLLLRLRFGTRILTEDPLFIFEICQNRVTRKDCGEVPLWQPLLLDEEGEKPQNQGIP